MPQLSPQLLCQVHLKQKLLAKQQFLRHQPVLQLRDSGAIKAFEPMTGGDATTENDDNNGGQQHHHHHRFDSKVNTRPYT